MELYGGGMTGPTTNYQLGGRISRGRIGRGAQEEAYELERKRREAAKSKKKAGLWGSLGSLAGGAIGAALAPVTGGASLALATGLGAGLGRLAGEKAGYTETDFGEGKYRKETRGALEESERDYRRGMGERALVSGAQAAFMPGMYEKAGSWLKGLGGAKEAATAAQAVDIAGAAPEFAAGFGTAPIQEGMAASGLQLPGMPELGATPSMAMEGFGSGMAGKLGAMPTTLASTVAPTTVSTVAPTLASAGGAGGIGEIAQDFMSYAPGESWYGGGFDDPLSDPLSMMSSRGRGMLPIRKGGGLINYMVPKMQGGGSTNPYGYGTAIDPMAALKQMGMGSVAADPRLKDYMAELPQFGMGYEQQLGDIRGGAQQALMGLTQPTAPAATSFAGAGAPAVAQQKAREQTMKQFGQQRRGVVEGYQADLLGAIRDIEQQGEFTFATGPTPWESLGITEEEYNKQIQAQQQQLLAGIPDIGVLDPTQGQTGMPGQQQPQQQWGQAQWGQQGQQQQQNPWQQQQQQTTTGWPTG